MASPQLENGYIKIANEIIEAFASFQMSGHCRRCLDVIVRKTYGFNKKKDTISLSQFCSVTKMCKPRICEALNKLAEMNIIITEKRNDGTVLYGFNKDFDTWNPLRKSVIITEKRNDHYGKAEQPLRKSVHTKDNKDTLTKDTSAISENRGSVKEPLRAVRDPEVMTVAAWKKELAENNPPAFDPKPCFRLFADPFPRNWLNNRTQRAAAKNLTAERGLEKVALAFGFWRKHKDEEYCPDCSTPWDMDSKWTKLQIFRDKRL